MTDLEGADPASQIGGCPLSSGFGRGGSGLSEWGVPPEQRIWKGRIRPLRGGAPRAADLEGADPASQRGVSPEQRV